MTNAMGWVRVIVLCYRVLVMSFNFHCDVLSIGIDFVKIKDEEVARKYKIFEVPTLVYFRRQHPIVYDGTEATFRMVNLTTPLSN